MAVAVRGAGSLRKASRRRAFSLRFPVEPLRPLFLWHSKTVSFSAEKKKWVLEVLVPHNGNIEKSSLCLNSLQKCRPRATFDWPKVAKGQSRRGISISPSLTIHPLKRPSTGGTAVPPIGSTPRGSSTVTSVSTGGLRCHAAGAGKAGAPPQQWDPWPNSKAFSPDKTVPPSIQGRHAPTPR